MSEAHPRKGNAGVAGNEELNSFYGTDMAAVFSRGRRQLCNKCHLKDQWSLYVMRRIAGARVDNEIA